MDPELVKGLLTGGSAGAVLIVVYFFLNHLKTERDATAKEREASAKEREANSNMVEKAHASVTTLAEKFITTIEKLRDDSDKRYSAITAQIQQNHKETQDQVTQLVRDSIESNARMTEAIRGLQVAVGDLQKKG